MSKKLQLIIVGALAAMNAVSQTDSSTKSLNPVILTANKLPQKQRTTGKVVTVITKDEIEKSAGRSLAQLLNEQAGITINGALNNKGTAEAMFIRGASPGRTLVLIDGVPVYDPSVINNEFDLSLISLANVECIEICKGAQSTIYGSDAIAGVINIITTKQNSTRPFSGQLQMAAGNYGTYRGNMKIAGTQGKFNFIARYSRLQTKGFSAAYDSSGSKGFDRDGYKTDIVNFSVNYKPSQFLSLKTYFQYSSNYSEIDRSAFSDEKDYSFTSKALITGMGMVYNKNHVSLITNYQYSSNIRQYLNDSLDKPGFVDFSKDRYTGKANYLEIYSKIQVNPVLSLLQGADYRHSKMESNNFSVSSFGPYETKFNDTSHSQASLYASILYGSINEKLNIDLGGRINVHSQYGSNSTFTFNPSYSFHTNYRLFGSIASGFKAPTLYQLYSDYGNRSLQPEKSRSYEIGFEQAHEKFTNRVVLFHRIIKGGIDFNYISFKYFNFNEQIVNGVEFESKFKPAKNFLINFNYTYLHPRENSQSRISFQDTTYRYLIRRPNHHANISLGYSFQNKAQISINGKYLSRRFDLGAYKEADIELENYFLLNAYCEYAFKKNLKLFGDFQNIMNRKFIDIYGYNSIPFLFSFGFTLAL